VIHGIPLEPGLTFACLAETILLGLTGATDHFSFGRVSKQQVMQIVELAGHHGFEFARSKIEVSY
jgi:predicted amino acid dehydrogenase